MRPSARLLGPTVAILLVLAAACTTHPADLPGAGDDWSDPSNSDQPVDPGDPSAPKAMVYAGRYQLNSVIDLAGAGAFGDTISGTLVQLSMFHENPAGTILNLL